MIGPGAGRIAKRQISSVFLDHFFSVFGTVLFSIPIAGEDARQMVFASPSIMNVRS